MPGLVDAARSIAGSLGMIASAARETAAELRDTAKAKTEHEQRTAPSSMGKAKGGGASSMGAGGASGQAPGMTPGSLAAALQSLTRRS